MQDSPFIGHVVPGIGFFFLGLFLVFYIFLVVYPRFFKSFTLFGRWKGGPRYWMTVIVFYIGVATLIISIYGFIAYMIDIANKDTGTKIHRVLNMLGLPLAIAMMHDAWVYPKEKTLIREGFQRNFIKGEMDRDAYEAATDPLINKETMQYINDEIKTIEEGNVDKAPINVLVFTPPIIKGNQEYNVTWRYVLPLYCAMNAIIYYGHHHGEDGMAMSGEEEAHQPFFWTYLFATYAYGISQYLAVDQIQHFLFLVGSLLFVVLGCWYIVAGVVLYGGAFGINGATYGDATADYGIILLVISTVSVMAYTIIIKL